MKTITIQIGNSDDQLAQWRWAEFVDMVNDDIRLSAWEIHFNGCSDPRASWQNACWVIEIKEENIFALKQELRSTAQLFSQDSIAWTEGTTELLTG